MDLLNLKFETRIDNQNYSNKESNFNLNLPHLFNLSLDYYLTSKDSYNDLTSDKEALKISTSSILNENVELNFNTNIDLRNNYTPYEQSLGVSFYDECSKLNVNYTNTKFNDNFNTKPTETIRLEFYMDYLGLVGYEQSTNLVDNSRSSDYYTSGF